MFDSSPSGVQPRVVAASSSINGEVETVTWLLHWCPHQARAFALAMHELAAWQYDDDRTERWRLVLGCCQGTSPWLMVITAALAFIPARLSVGSISSSASSANQRPNLTRRSATE